MILIIGNSSEMEKPVLDEIANCGKKAIVFQANKCLENESAGFSVINKYPKPFLIKGGKVIGFENIDAIWFWKPIPPKELRTHKDAYFIASQFNAMWRSLALLLRDRRWVNDYFKILEAEHKPYQLQTALLAGFNVPDTLITSDPYKAREFYYYCDREMVIKTLQMTIREDSFGFTNRFTDDLLPKLERLKSSPVILQKLLNPKVELRITVVGDQVFPARVESDSELDWRKSKKVIMDRYKLPKEIKRKCLRLVKMLNLQYGCIDMVITQEGKYMFLEINSNGQWIFVEKNTGMPIGKAIAHLLI